MHAVMVSSGFDNMFSDSACIVVMLNGNSLCGYLDTIYITVSTDHVYILLNSVTFTFLGHV